MFICATTRIAIRQRLINANGHAENQVIVGNLAPTELLIDQMGQWLTAIKADTSRRPLAEKVVANKPADVVDACWTTDRREDRGAADPGRPRPVQPALPGRGAAGVRGRRADRSSTSSSAA